MKKQLLLASLAMLLGIFTGISTANAQSVFAIFGQVTDANGAAMAGHDVTIVSDSSFTGFFYWTTVTTDANGNYSDTITGFPMGNQIFYVSTADCNQGFQNQTVTNNQGSTTFANVDFQLCFNSGTGSSCAASFQMYPDSIDPNTYYFGNLSTGTGLSYSWDFGDNSLSTMQYPSHTYATAGAYLVCLTVTSSGGCTDTYCDTIVISGTGSNCAANFAFYPDTTAPNSFYFSDMSTGTGLSYSWDFGDNSSSTLQYPSHTYATAGTYNVCLTITSSTGCTDTDCTTVTITGTGGNCLASFTTSTQGSFASFVGSGPIFGNYSYSWDFGDGTSGTGQQVSNNYSVDGLYLVCLTVDDNMGCTDTYCDSIQISTAPPPACAASFTLVENGLTIDLTATSTDPDYTYTWYFGDGNSNGPGTTNTNVQHTYATGGTYWVALEIIDSLNNCWDSTISIITLQGNPVLSNNIYGTVWAGQQMVYDNATAYLIEYDATSATLNAIDTVPVDSGMYNFGTVPNGAYYVKVALEPASNFYSGYLPTYYGDELLWTVATSIIVPAANNLLDVNLIAGNNAGGPGFIGGNVWQGANKTQGEGDPVEGVHILLLDESDNPVAHTTSNADGEYEFSNLAYGTYKIWAEVWGKNTTPNLATISANDENHTDVNIVIGDTEVTTFIEVVDARSNSSVGMFPNPFNTQATFTFDVEQGSNVTVTFLNAVGQRVLTVNEAVSAGVSNVDVATDELPAGLYFVNISSDSGFDFTRKVVKTN